MHCAISSVIQCARFERTLNAMALQSALTTSNPIGEVFACFGRSGTGNRYVGLCHRRKTRRRAVGHNRPRSFTARRYTGNSERLAESVHGRPKACPVIRIPPAAPCRQRPCYLWTRRGHGNLGGWKSGEPEGIRTLDPLIKSQVLYRLSYGLSSPGPYGCVAGKVNIKGSPATGSRLSRLEKGRIRAS